MNPVFRVQGSIYGLLIGDALGVARPNKFNATTQSVAQLMARNYADAGGMTLCTMSSLTDCEKIDLEDMATIFNEWYVAGYMVSDEASMEGRVTVSQALRRFSNGTPPDRCGCKTDLSDSALMRMLPVALWCYNEPVEEIVKQAHAITKFTNLHVEAEAYSALFCLLIRGILLQKKDKATGLLKKHYAEEGMKDHAEALINIQVGAGDTGIRDSFWNAWTAYAENQDNFENVMKNVLTSKSSTVGIAGALIGANVGLNDIPQRWINQLALPDDGKNVIEKFVKRIISRT